RGIPVSEMALLITSFLFPPPRSTWIHSPPLHDALPIFRELFSDPDTAHDFALTLLDQDTEALAEAQAEVSLITQRLQQPLSVRLDRKSTRLNSSHVKISYAVFCLKKKKTQTITEDSIPS